VSKQIHRLSDQKDKLEVLEVKVQRDLVFLVVSIPPKLAISQYIGFLKGKFALRLFDRFTQLRKKYWRQHVWSRRYCMSTAGLIEERIRKYVNWQSKKE
ncbi:MAG: IS200/IS605 family transposase, partial [Anaerolineae bacterium]|nr:IS200/IS605 family transposase [Anaerolineae bacterium]